MIIRHLKIVRSLVTNFSQITRNFAAAKKLPVEWIRPPKVSCISPEHSGDLGLKFDIAPSDRIHNFDISTELEKASPLVQKMYSVEFNRRRDLIKLQKEKAIKLVQRHANDRGSREANVAQMTVEILQLQERQFTDEFKRDSRTNVFLKEMIEKRKKMLNLIRKQDYACFEYLLEKLNLKFYPYLEENPPIHRKPCTKKLLQKHCDELVQKKLKEYKTELESQMRDFYKEKAEKLEFIRNEEIACGVDPTVSEEEIESAKQKAAQ